MKSLFRRKASFTSSRASPSASPARSSSQPRGQQDAPSVSPPPASALPTSLSARSLEAPQLQLHLSRSSTDAFDLAAFGAPGASVTPAAPTRAAAAADKAATLPSRRGAAPTAAASQSPAKSSAAAPPPSAWRAESPQARRQRAPVPSSWDSAAPSTTSHAAPPSEGHSFATAAESPSGSPGARRSPLPMLFDGAASASAAAAAPSPLASLPALTPESSTSSLVHVSAAEGAGSSDSAPGSESESHEAITPASLHHARFSFARPPQQQKTGIVSKEHLPLMHPAAASPSRYPSTPDGNASPRTNFSRPTMSPPLGAPRLAASPIASSDSVFVSVDSHVSPARAAAASPPSLQLRTAPTSVTPQRRQNDWSAPSAPLSAPTSPPRVHSMSAASPVTPTGARRSSALTTPTSRGSPSAGALSPSASDAASQALASQRELARDAKARAAAEAHAVAEEQRLAKEQRARERAQREAEERLLQEQADREAAAVQERGRLAAEQAREMRRLQQAESSRAAEQAKVREAQEADMKRQQMWAAQREEEARLRDQQAVAAERAAAQQLHRPPHAHPPRSYSAITTHDSSARLVVPRRKASETNTAAAGSDADAVASPMRAAVMASPAQATQMASPLMASPTQAAAQVPPRSPIDMAPAQRAMERFSVALAEGARAKPAGLLSASSSRQSLPAETRPADPAAIVHGDGWMCHGVVDPRLTKTHRRFEKVVVLRPRSELEAHASRRAKRKQARLAAGATPPLSAAGSDAAASELGTPDEAHHDEELVECVEQRMYSDLGELIWTRTTPDVIARLISHLDCADVKALRQTSSAIRLALGQLAGREVTLRRFLAPFGYRTWEPSRAHGGAPREDPMPISLAECEAFLISYDLVPEYASVGRQYAANPRSMDPQIPRLARATTRAYNRVLARLRMQPYFKVPEPRPSAVAFASSASMTNSPPQPQQLATRLSPGDAGAPVLPSPWRPGRAALFRVWVPAADPSGWMSDEELARCERQMYECGVWTTALRRGDVVWNTAVGDQANMGKQIFDGQYLRDLSFLHDPAGHLPSHVNSLTYPPSYFHNIVHSSTPHPVIYIDILPWRNELLASLRLVQDHIESVSPQGRYRVAKWLYRAVVNVTGGQIISTEGLQVVDEGWHGKLVIETEGTSEHAKALIARCAGPTASAGARAALLASVMGEAGRQSSFAPPSTRDASGATVEATTPWAIIRERSRPGQIWMRPV